MTPRAPHVPVGVLFFCQGGWCDGDVVGRVLPPLGTEMRSGTEMDFFFFLNKRPRGRVINANENFRKQMTPQKRAESPDCALTHRFSSWTQRIYKFSLVQARKQPHGPATKRWRYVSPESRLLIVRKSPKFNVFLMYERRLDIAVAFIAIAVSPLLLDCRHTTTCEVSLTQWFYRFIELLFIVGKYLKRIRFITSKSDVWWVNASFFFF